MTTVVIVGAVVLLLGVGFMLFLRMLGRRVVAVSRPRKPVEVRAAADGIVLPRSVLTEAPGAYGLWFGEDFSEHATVGDVVTSGESTVTRVVSATTTPLPAAAFPAHWTGHTLRGPEGLDRPWNDVDVPLAGGGVAPAWFFPAEAADAPWAVHVQGIRTSRLVTLRAVEAAQRAGFASLVITYRGAGDGAPASASRLGLDEWTDLRDAVAYARSHGASGVVVIAWSMGAGLALELAQRDPSSVDRLILICPATDWRAIIRHGAKQAHLPAFVGSAAIWLLGAPVVSRIVGLTRPIDFDALDWTRAGAVTVPTLVVHSPGDAEIPFALSQRFAAAHVGVVSLVQTKTAPHGWEPNVDPAGFAAAIDSWLIRAEN